MRTEPRKVLIGPSSFGDADPAPLRLLERAGLQVLPNPYRRRLSKEELIALLSDDVVGILAGQESLDRDVLCRSRLRVISRVGAGMSNVDVEAAHELGIEVRSTPDAPTEAVAELTLGALLSLLRNVPQMNQALHEGRWVKSIGVQLEGKTVAVVGFGRIGRRVAELLRPFRVRLLVVDPFVPAIPPGTGERVTLEEALPVADIITLHSSGEDCLLDAQAFERMKPGVFLLNAARGGLIDDVAFLRAVERGTVAGAWLDAFWEEPYKGPLCRHPNVLLTPHVGSYTAECRLRMETEAVENLLDALGLRAGDPA